MPKILIISQNVKTSNLLREFMDRKGYGTYTISEVNKSFNWLKSNRTDIIIYYCGLQNKKGLEFLQRIKVYGSEMAFPIKNNIKKRNKRSIIKDS